MQKVKRDNRDSISLLMETSWEVCNKIGGIYTVLSTKARVLQEKYSDRLIFIGPDVWTDKTPSPYFVEQKALLKSCSSKMKLPYGISVRTGKWNIPGSPQVVLVKFDGVYEQLNGIFGKMWELYGVDSMHAYGDYHEGCAFAVASAIVMAALAEHLKVDSSNVVAHFNEWTTAMGLLYLKMTTPEARTIFTTHATSIGRSICGNGKPLYDYFHGYHGDQMARELNMEAKHSLEKSAAHQADCFTAVSDLTADECEQLLDIRPQVVTPNGFEPDFVPESKQYEKLRSEGRKHILSIAHSLTGKNFKDENTIIVATSGRNEYRNKGLDLFIDSVRNLNGETLNKQVLALILVPAWVKEPSAPLLEAMDKGNVMEGAPVYMTHRLNNEDHDSITCRLRTINNDGDLNGNVSIIYVPCYLDGNDGVVNISYYDFLPAIDISVFCSYYEPWGYTPLESIAFGVPTVTTDKSGFGQWILSHFVNSLLACGVDVVGRTDSNYGEAACEISRQLKKYADMTPAERKDAGKAAASTAEKADWKYFIKAYDEAFEVATRRRDERIK
ncbi:MAG: glycosyltransferase [Muribaculaceae bacterium]|nr:glycosyltransferase [Muribaculaceae bacterium]